jgi:hypothetical protein
MRYDDFLNYEIDVINKWKAAWSFFFWKRTEYSALAMSRLYPSLGRYIDGDCSAIGTQKQLAIIS